MGDCFGVVLVLLPVGLSGSISPCSSDIGVACNGEYILLFSVLGPKIFCETGSVVPNSCLVSHTRHSSVLEEGLACETNCCCGVAGLGLTASSLVEGTCGEREGDLLELLELSEDIKLTVPILQLIICAGGGCPVGIGEEDSKDW